MKKVINSPPVLKFFNMRSAKTTAAESVSNELFLSIPFSLIYTHLIVGFNQKSNYLKLLLVRDYVSDLAFRFVWAYVLILLIKFATRYLDVKRPWSTRKWSRLFIQVFYCFICVVVFDFFVATFYFDSKGIHISNTAYFNIQLILTCIYITIINLYYNFQGFLATKEKMAVSDVVVTKCESRGKKANAEIARYASDFNIVYIAISNKVHYAKNILGEAVIWSHNLTESIAALPADQFYKAGRSCIVRRDAISVTIEPKKRRVIVMLKLPLKIEIKIPDANVEDFIEWWHQNEEWKSFQAPHESVTV